MAATTSSRAWMTAGLASRGRRLASAAVAIIIGVAFVALSLATITTAQRGTEDAVGAGLRDADLVVTGADDSWLDTRTYDAVAAVPEVETVTGETGIGVETPTQDWMYAATMPVSGMTLLQGQMPQAPGEILVNPDLGERSGVGETLTLLPVAGEDGAPAVDAEPVTVTVAGVADFGSMSALGYGSGFATDDATLRSLDAGLMYQAALVTLADGADAASARSALEAAGDVVVQTGPEAAADRVASYTGGTDVLAAILLGFGAVALATAAIVIANTFTITLAQRTGELALLRAVGATTAQVRRLVILEAVLLGLVASAAGVLLGLLGAWGLLAVAGRFDLGVPLADTITVTPLIVGVPLLVGVVVTVLASLWPAVRATRVSPLAALRPVGEAAERRRVGWVRLGLAVLLIAGGVGLMAVAATQRQILFGVAGGVLSFAGMLVAAVVVVPAAVRALGLGARLAGTPGRLAVDNAVRNPGRAASTSAALLVGVTLITMTTIGAASAEQTALGEIDSSYAVDFILESGGEHMAPEAGTDPGAMGGGRTVPDVAPLPMPAAVEGQVAGVEGVRTARAVPVSYLALGESLGATPAFGLDPVRDADVVRSPALAELVPGTIGLSSQTLAMEGLSVGDTVTVHGYAASDELTVVPLGVGYSYAVNEADLTRLGGDRVVPGAVLVGLTDDADVAAAMGAIQDAVQNDSLTLSGSAMERAVITGVLDVLVLVTTGLLGVAVLIAVVGIANTLSLSVIERQREHALLRGMGLTRGQMRAMLVTEGVLLAVVSAGLGLVLGAVYAGFGIQTLLPEDTPVQLMVPWATVGIIVGVALLAGALASVLPARKAARVSPAEGLVAA